MKRIGIVAALMLFLYCPTGRLEAAENLRAASGGFTTAIHAVLWATVTTNLQSAFLAIGRLLQSHIRQKSSCKAMLLLAQLRNFATCS